MIGSDDTANDVGVLTFHRASNYGAVLQAYALQVAIRELGHRGEVLDYRSPFLERHYTPDGWRTLLSPRKTGIALLRNGYMMDRREIFADFVREEVPLSPMPVSREDISEAAGGYRLLITGSDQVWNHETAGFDPTFFLDFVEEPDRRAAYAASLGLSEIPAKHLEEYRRLLGGFGRVSVRESAASTALESILGYRPPVVLDPTMLLDPEAWERVSSKGMRLNEPYVLVYLLAETPQMLTYARRLGRELGVRVVYVSQRLMRPRGVEVLSVATPYDFVSLFSSASAVVTNSFHGMAFALSFNRDLHYDHLPEPSRVNSRLQNLSNMLGLGARKIVGELMLEPREQRDVERTEKILQEERIRSREFLAEVLRSEP